MTLCLRLLAVLLILLAASLVTCAPKRATPDVVQWNLSPEAQDTYHYLLLEDAKRARNATIGDYALEHLLKSNAPVKLFIEGANFYWRAGKAQKTKDILKQGLEKFPKAIELKLMLAQVLLAEKKFPEAIAILKEYLANTPNDTLTRQELADILIQNEQFAEALAILEKIAPAERSPVIRYFTAKALSGLGKRPQAVRLLKEIVQKDKDFLEAWAELAYLYELDKDYVGAEQTYASILNFGDPSQELLLRLMEVNLKLNNPDKALSFVAKGSNEPAFAIKAASTFLDQGFYDQAEKILLPLVEKKPDSFEAYFYLAVLSFEGRKDAAKASAYLEKIPESHRFFERALRFRAHLLHEQGNEDQALALSEKGRAQFPEQKDFWLLSTRILDLKEKPNDALTIIEAAAAKWPEDTDILFNQGALLDKVNDKDKALKVMDKIRALDPDHADALNYIGYTMAEKGESLDQAEALVKKALQQKPDNGYIIDSLAWVYFKQGKKQQAWEEVAKAVKKTQDDPIIWEHYGDIAASLGAKAEAAKGYQKSLSLNPKEKDAVQKKLNAL